MSMTDPIADLLTRIRNANRARKVSVDIPSSKIKEQICHIMQEEGFIAGYDVIPDNKQNILRVKLNYLPKKEPVLTGLERISRPGSRVYVEADEIKSVFGGLGISILSTSQGIITDRQARKAGIGGELLCRVW
jgi:small subunit ribosomal protein S8